MGWPPGIGNRRLVVITANRLPSARLAIYLADAPDCDRNLFRVQEWLPRGSVDYYDWRGCPFYVRQVCARIRFEAIYVAFNPDRHWLVDHSKT